jgi:MFS family permease
MTTTTINKSRIVALSPIHYGWIVWIVATIGWTLTAPGQSFTVSLFFNSFIEDFGLSRTTVSGLYGLGTFIGSLSLTGFGFLIDRYGNRKLGVIIAIVFSIAVAAMSLVTGPVTLLLGFLAIRMFGQGALSLVNTTVLAEWFKRLRGRMMSFSLVIFALFQAAYVPWLQRQLEVRDWREMWLILGIAVGSVVIPLTWLLMRNTPEEHGLLPDGKRVSIEDDVELEVNEEDSWSLPQVMRTSVFWVFVMGRIVSPAWGTGLILHQISIFEQLGYSARTAAETYAMLTIITAISSILFGWMVDRLRPGMVMALQLLALIVAMIAATMMTTQTLLFIYALSFGIMMGGGAVFDGAVWVNLFGRKYQGSIRGFVITTLVAGSALGPILFGLSFDYLGSYNPVLWLGVAIAVVSTVAALIVPLPKRKTSSS